MTSIGVKIAGGVAATAVVAGAIYLVSVSLPSPTGFVNAGANVVGAAGGAVSGVVGATGGGIGDVLAGGGKGIGSVLAGAGKGIGGIGKFF